MDHEAFVTLSGEGDAPVRYWVRCEDCFGLLEGPFEDPLEAENYALTHRYVKTGQT